MSSQHSASNATNQGLSAVLSVSLDDGAIQPVSLYSTHRYSPIDIENAAAFVAGKIGGEAFSVLYEVFENMTSTTMSAIYHMRGPAIIGHYTRYYFFFSLQSLENQALFTHAAEFLRDDAASLLLVNRLDRRAVADAAQQALIQLHDDHAKSYEAIMKNALSETSRFQPRRIRRAVAAAAEPSATTSNNPLKTTTAAQKRPRQNSTGSDTDVMPASKRHMPAETASAKSLEQSVSSASLSRTESAKKLAPKSSGSSSSIARSPTKSDAMVGVVDTVSPEPLQLAAAAKQTASAPSSNSGKSKTAVAPESTPATNSAKSPAATSSVASKSFSTPSKVPSSTASTPQSHGSQKRTIQIANLTKLADQAKPTAAPKSVAKPTTPLVEPSEPKLLTPAQVFCNEHCSAFKEQILAQHPNASPDERNAHLRKLISQRFEAVSAADLASYKKRAETTNAANREKYTAALAAYKSQQQIEQGRASEYTRRVQESRPVDYSDSSDSDEE